MTRHILIRTDGSELSQRTAERGVAFAEALGASVIALHVIPQLHAFTFRARVVLTYRTILEHDTQAEFHAQTLRCARMILQYVERAAGYRADTPRSMHAGVHVAQAPIEFAETQFIRHRGA